MTVKPTNTTPDTKLIQSNLEKTTKNIELHGKMEALKTKLSSLLNRKNLLPGDIDESLSSLKSKINDITDEALKDSYMKVLNDSIEGMQAALDSTSFTKKNHLISALPCKFLENFLKLPLKAKNNPTSCTNKQNSELLKALLELENTAKKHFSQDKIDTAIKNTQDAANPN